MAKISNCGRVLKRTRAVWSKLISISKFIKMYRRIHKYKTMDSKLISKVRRSALKAKIRMACVACIAYNHRCSDSRPCKMCVKAKKSCVDSSKHLQIPCDMPLTVAQNQPQPCSMLAVENVCLTHESTLAGSEWAGSEARKLMSLGYRVQFLEQFFSCLSFSNRQALSHAMNTAITTTTRDFFNSTLSFQRSAETYEGPGGETENEAVFCISWDSRTGQRTFHSNSRNAALFGMRCEEFISRASNFDLAIPLSEVDALILLLYRSVHRIKGQEPAVIFLRMYIGASRTGSLIRESLRVENDELHRRKEVRSAALDSARRTDQKNLRDRKTFFERLSTSLSFGFPPHFLPSPQFARLPPDPEYRQKQQASAPPRLCHFADPHRPPHH